MTSSVDLSAVNNPRQKILQQVHHLVLCQFYSNAFSIGAVVSQFKCVCPSGCSKR